MAAAGESALAQKLKETETIQWYKGECTVRDYVVPINTDNPNDPDTFEGKVRACINKKSSVSANDVNEVWGHVQRHGGTCRH